MNDIVIGLGGTGGKVINRLKHKLYKKTLNVEYLYIDSNFDLVDKDTHLWKVFGDDISLHARNLYRLTSKHLHGVFNFTHNIINPPYNNWVGNINHWNNLRNALASGGAVYGSQRRRLGRMLLSGHIKSINNEIKNLVQILQNNNPKVQKTFHVCAGLSGGTGSGSFIDILIQLKQNYPNDTIILYLVLPENNANIHKLAGGNYYANAYAALKELNALYCGQFIPYDLVKSIKNNKLPAGVNFQTTTYIMTNTNDAGHVLNVDKMQVEDMIADFMNLRLTNQAYAGSLTQTENTPPTSEVEHNTPVRSRSFFTFGIKRVIYPQDEITEYMTAKIQHSLSIALMYNNWVQNRGYNTTNQILNINILVQSKLATLKLTDDYLLLEKGVMGNEDWQNFNNEWRGYIDGFVRNGKTNRVGDKDIATNAIASCSTRYQTQYRSDGVERFFQNYSDDLSNRVNTISKIIQENLISDWLNGNYSLLQLSNILNQIVSYLTQKQKDFQQKEANIVNTLNMNQNDLNVWSRKLNQCKVFTTIEFNNVIEYLKVYYVNQTLREAYSYSDTLITSLLNRLQIIKNEYLVLVTTFTTYSTNLQNTYTVRLNNNNQSIEKIYNVNMIDNLVDNYILNNQASMNGFKTIIANKMVDRDFKSLDKAFNNINTQQAINFQFDTQLNDIINQIQVVNPQFNINNISIIDELSNQYGGKVQNVLNTYIHTLEEQANCYLPLNDVEINRVNPKRNNSMFVDIIPKSQFFLYPNIQGATFTQNILKALSIPAAHQVERNDGLTNELTFCEIQPVLPLRYIDKLQNLSTEYTNRYIGDASVDAQIHLEGKGTDYQNITIPDIGDLQIDSIYKLFILDACGEIKDNAQVGGLYIDILGDDNKVISIVRLGKDFITAHTQISDYDIWMDIDGKYNLILNDVKKLFFQPKQDKKKDILYAINEKYKEIEDYFRPIDISQVPFWGQHSQKASDKIEGL